MKKSSMVRSLAILGLAGIILGALLPALAGMNF